MVQLHIIQEKLLKLSEKENLANFSLREMARKIGLPNESPQKIKHHLMQLQKKGFLSIDRIKGVTNKTEMEPSWAKGLLKKANQLFSVPIIGTANCGPATIFAEQNFQGFLRISSRLIGRKKPDNLFAIKADGLSMNRAEINNKYIEDGDFVIVDKEQVNPETGNIVLVIIDNKATIKKLIKDKKNNQIVLKAESSFNYDPIYLHKDDNFFINGKVIDVIKKPLE